MKKFINHVDHVAWLSRPENLGANVTQLETLTGATLTRFSREDMGFTMCISWEAGLEVVAPMEARTEFNQWLWSELEAKGEGVTSVVFGVQDLDAHKARLEKLGFAVGPLMDDHPDSPWHDKLVLLERVAGQAMNTNVVLGDIDYADEVIPFADAGSPASEENRAILLDRARSIAGLIEAEANKVEAETRITRPIHEALCETGLIWAPLPREHGGGDADIATCIELVEEISRADGSTGWSFFVNLATFSGIFPFMSKETLAVLYADGRPPVCAGQLVATGRSEAAEGGYRCSGKHNFASGSAFADWICAAQVLHEGDRPVLDTDGLPRSTIAVLRRQDVEFQGNWDVMGLAGSGSYDYEVHAQVVPSVRVLDGAVLSPFAEPLRGNAMLRMGALAAAYSLHTACVLGIAKRAMQEIAALASRKTRAGYAGPIAEDPVFLNAFAQIDAEYHAARGRLIDVFRAAEAKVAAGQKLTLDDHAIMRQTATWTHGKAGEVVAACFRWAGTTPVRNPSVLGRCMRDVLVANSHMLFDPKTLTDAGPVLVRRWTDG